MKKIVTFLVCTTMMLVLCSCNEKKSSESVNNVNNAQNSVADANEFIGGSWYCEKEDICFQFMDNDKLYIAEHGENYEQTWGTTDTITIDDFTGGTPDGYEGFLLTYPDDKPKHWVYRFENGNLILAQVFGESADLPEAPVTGFKIESERIFKHND
ncbi:MAG: hypothetical protein J6B01_03740 [Ruminococcus sp.]|nr:hypothetical protein [Ruminococcus sp.]